MAYVSVHKNLMFMYIIVGSNFETFTNIIAMIKGMIKLPHNKGMVLGLLNEFAGSSGFVFT